MVCVREGVCIHKHAYTHTNTYHTSIYLSILITLIGPRASLCARSSASRASAAAASAANQAEKGPLVLSSARKAAALTAS